MPAGLIGLGLALIAQADNSVAGAGFDVIGLNADGRIHTDHQFIEGVR
ncbi:hypothetical protein [Nocardia iowensis]|uniref:Uncharacterized protein n=1 Tax=Nocardia iowensis TaxID=204891 RepID=A0ABX8RTC2_NOCIO|nr:hypothetical protein [Nocardia iowensis]QXN92888.1 hypothetical protein KV110_07165 [Nocardia iowensis]